MSIRHLCPGGYSQEDNAEQYEKVEVENVRYA